MPVTPEAKRFQVVKKDLKESLRGLGSMLGVSHVSIRRMLTGEQELNFSVISGICTKFGYSPSWLILGIGDKMIKGVEGKLVTEIQILRMEMDITANLNLRLQSRLTAMEKEQDELKQRVEELSKVKTG